MEKNKSITRKKSFIAGALISSAGVFFAKLIGLIYAIPFNNILQTSVNVEYYGSTQVLYMYLLNVCQAGFPFAIATLVARYMSREDYETCLLVKKMSSCLMISLGFVMMLLLIVFSSPVANLIYQGDGNPADFRLALVCSAFALFFVPILSSIRGFYQGLKEMELYSFSQVLEQLTNASFVLIASSIAVFIFHQDRIWAVYLGVLATSVAAITAMLHLKSIDRRKMVEFKRLKKQQKTHFNISWQMILSELLRVSIPFMIIAILGYSDSIINVLFLNKGLVDHGSTAYEITLISSTINYKVLKLMSIPMVLAPGFSSAIIPHITSAITKKDYQTVRKNILQCIDIVIYIALPVSLCLGIFSKPLIATLFPPEHAKDLVFVAQILVAFSFVAFMNTLTPIMTSLLVSTGLRKKSVLIIVIQNIVKFSLSYFLLVKFGYMGLVISTGLASIVCVVLAGYQMYLKFKVDWKYTFRKLAVIIMGCFVMFVVANICFNLGLDYDASRGRVVSFIIMCIAGIISVIAYFIFTYMFNLPQMLLNFDLKKILKRLR